MGQRQGVRRRGRQRRQRRRRGASAERPDRQPGAERARRRGRVKATEHAARAHHPDRATQVRDLAAPQQALARRRPAAPRRSHADGVERRRQAGRPGVVPAARSGPRPCLLDRRARARGARGPVARQRHAGAVAVGASADTSACAVTAMAHSGADRGRLVDPQARPRWLVADAGGRQGGRPRRWNAPRHSPLSDRRGLRVTVWHAPTGGSPWPPMAPRWCRHSRLKWAGQPWRTVATLLGDRRGTTTTTGVRVTASWRKGGYPPGTRGAHAVMQTRQVDPHAGCPPWHSTIRPRVDGALTPGVRIIFLSKRAPAVPASSKAMGTSQGASRCGRRAQGATSDDRRSVKMWRVQRPWAQKNFRPWRWSTTRHGPQGRSATVRT